MPTSFSLSDKPRIKYSQRERLVFKTLNSGRVGKVVTTRDIADKIFRDSEIFHVNATVISALASLKRKVEFNGEDFRVATSGHSGPKPMKVWLEKID